MLDKVIVFGMGGWLDLTQQGLSPCKKYRASWRSSAKSYRIIELAQPSPGIPFLIQIWRMLVNIIFINFHF